MGNDKFIELVTKHLSGDISQNESAELKNAISNNVDYKHQYDALCMYWDHKDDEYTDDAIAFQKIKDKISKLDDSDSDAALPFISPARSTKQLYFWRIAAGLLLVTSFSYFIYRFTSKQNQDLSANNWQQQTTINGAKSVLILTDGTKVTLNSHTTLKYPAKFDGATREVTLTGEAYFDVKKDHAHPFIIHTAKMNVKVLGTAFNVKSYPNEPESETTLIRGAIEVTLNDRPSDRIILKPNEKLIVKNSSTAKQSANIKQAPAGSLADSQYVLTTLTYLHQNDSTVSETAWLNNRFFFNNDTFEVLAVKMERWYGVNIEFKNQAAKQYSFTGVFENDTVVQALEALKRIEKFNYKISKSTVYIY
ncbi:FecR family protein [Inquilinus sp. KBS0705]|nr:FecR family protein [Inquilinus sp. KBS0705]